MRLRSVVPKVVVGLFVASGAMFVSASLPAFAVAGGATDADDSAGFDIESIYHSDDGQEATYGVDAYEPFEDDDAAFIWVFELSGDDQPDACVAAGEDAGTLAALFAEDCDDQVVTDLPAPSRPSGDRIEVRVQLQLLRDAGLGDGDRYEYGVFSIDQASNVDTVPDGDPVTHVLGASASPSPTATASPAPTPTPSPASASPPASSSPVPLVLTSSGTGSLSTQATLPRTGASVFGLVLSALVLLLFGIELLGLKIRLGVPSTD